MLPTQCTGISPWLTFNWMKSWNFYRLVVACYLDSSFSIQQKREVQNISPTNLCVCVCVCEIWCLVLIEERTLRVSENRMLRKAVRHKCEEEIDSRLQKIVYWRTPYFSFAPTVCSSKLKRLEPSMVNCWQRASTVLANPSWPAYQAVTYSD